MSEPLVVGRAYPAGNIYAEYDVGKLRDIKPITHGVRLSGTFDPRLPVGKAVALVYELREEKKISSTDFAVLMAVLEPIAYAECAALDGTKSA